MTTTAPTLPSTPHTPPPRWLGALLVAYVALLLAGLATANGWVEALAALVLVTLLLSPGLRRRSGFAWALWLLACAGCAALTARGHGRLALDLLPVFVNSALCFLFARTLARGREPLIARIIDVLEGRDRLALPRVAAYARALTLAWALLFGVQATILFALIAFAAPDGLLAVFGLRPPHALSGDGWRWYLHVGSYAMVLAFLVLEYAFRRRHLAHLPHAPLLRFVARLARRWPALVRRFAEDGERSTPAPIELRERFRVAATHPSLAGHFPGDPIVPGVVLLDRVAAALERAGGGGFSRIGAVKFVSPLRPDEDAELCVSRDGVRLRFRIERAGSIIVSGEGEVA